MLMCHRNCTGIGLCITSVQFQKQRSFQNVFGSRFARKCDAVVCRRAVSNQVLSSLRFLGFRRNFRIVKFRLCLGSVFGYDLRGQLWLLLAGASNHFVRCCHTCSRPLCCVLLFVGMCYICWLSVGCSVCSSVTFWGCTGQSLIACRAGDRMRRSDHFKNSLRLIQDILVVLCVCSRVVLVGF